MQLIASEGAMLGDGTFDGVVGVVVGSRASGDGRSESALVGERLLSALFGDRTVTTADTSVLSGVRT